MEDKVISISNETVTLILGVIAGALPSIFAFAGQLVNGILQRKHETRLKRTEIFTTHKVQSLAEFSRILGICTSIQDRKDNEEIKAKLLQEYMSAYEAVILFASQPTREAMTKLSYPFGVESDDSDLCALNECLNREYKSALSSMSS